MSYMLPEMPSPVSTVFSSYPTDVRQKLMQVRTLIFSLAGEDHRIGPLTETLKWGEPAYLTAASRSGSTIRLGQSRSNLRNCAVFFNCRTRLVSEFRQWFPESFTYEGNRAILFDKADESSLEKLAVGLRMALIYHLR